MLTPLLALALFAAVTVFMVAAIFVGRAFEDAETRRVEHEGRP